MLNAILHGKKRGAGTQGESLATTFSGAEDTLTATVFERIFYLPDEMIEDILMSSEWWGTNSPDGPIEEILFWPRWDSALSAGQKEPDVVVVWKDRILVIEAKRNDFVGMQKHDQLAHEYASAEQKYSGKDIYLLAVGGLADKRPQTINNLKDGILNHLKANARLTDDLDFYATTWYDLAKRVEEIVNGSPHKSVCLERLLIDIQEGMLLHGVTVASPAWLIELTEKEWLHTRGLNSKNIFSFISRLDVATEVVPSNNKTLLTQVGISTRPEFFYRR